MKNKDKQQVVAKLLTEAEVAEVLGVSKAWCQRKRWAKSGPPYRKLGRTVRYPADELDAWIGRHGLQGETQ